MLNMNMRAVFNALAGLALAGMATQPACGQLLDSENGPVRTTPDSNILLALSATGSPARFSLQIPGLDRKIAFPETNLIEVMLPARNVTVIAETSCGTSARKFMQLTPRDSGRSVDFTFHAADGSNCSAKDLEPLRPTAGSLANSQQSRIALVIADGRYEKLAALPFVDRDRDVMADLLAKSGYLVRRPSNGGFSGIESTLRSFAKDLASRHWDVVLVYLSGHGTMIDGRAFLAPTDLSPGAPVDTNRLVAIERIANMLRPAKHSGSEAVLLTDMCLTEEASGAKTQHGLAAISGLSLLNHATSAGQASFQDPGSSGMSMWSKHFATIAADHPEADLSTLVRYANRYVIWNSDTSSNRQNPTLYLDGRAGRTPFSQKGASGSSGWLPPL